MIKYITLILISVFSISCSKDIPSLEVDQEEVGSVELQFTEVSAELNGNQYTYSEMQNPQIESIKFSGPSMNPPADEHTHLSVGKSYRFNLKIKDFQGRETQQSFIEKEEQHFAFLLGLPENSALVTYNDIKNDGTKVKVGINGYITILNESINFKTRYIVRHLNSGVKEKINPSIDWNNSNFTSFTGANDIDLKFYLHFSKEETGH